MSSVQMEAMVDQTMAQEDKRQVGRSRPTILGVVAAVAMLLATAGEAHANTAWSPGPPMMYKRYRHKATVLDDGRVLVTGGVGMAGTSMVTAEIYNPATNAWTSVAPMLFSRQFHTATLLMDGRVLVTGGAGIGGAPLTSAEVYDPVANTWTPVPPMSVVRTEHTAIRMNDGRVIVAGGGLNEASAEIFDPQLNMWTSAGMMNRGRSGHTATLLNNGKILHALGASSNIFAKDAVLYDPAQAAWSVPLDLFAVYRQRHTETTLMDGSVLIAAGGYTSVYRPEAVRYLPSSNTVVAINNLHEGRYSHAAALLPNGRALVMGGIGIVGGVGGQSMTSAEAYDQATTMWFKAGSLKTPRREHTATALANGTVIVVGGYSTAALETTEIFKLLPTGAPCTAQGPGDTPYNAECDSGFCVDGVCCNVMACSKLDQCHDPGTCQLGTGQCSNPPSANGTSCNDGTLCTQSDACQAGACVGANPVVCTAMDTCHDVGTCDPMTGACSKPVKADGSSCNDGNGCTQTDACSSGTCIGTNPQTCAADDCHTAGTCDPMTGACSNPLPAGTLCGAKECTNGTWQGQGQCDATGACLPGPTQECGPFQCTLDGCDKGCMQDSDCPPGPECQRYVCNPNGHQCTLSPLSDGAPCASGGSCVAGTCIDGMSTSSSSSGGGGTSNSSSGSSTGGSPGTGGMGGAEMGGAGGMGGANGTGNQGTIDASGGGCACQTSGNQAQNFWGYALGLALMVWRRKKTVGSH